MMRVKIIKNSAANLERDINEALMAIGSEPGFKIKLEDIKLIEAGGPGVLTAMIIYNRTTASPANGPNAQPTRG